MKNLSETEKVQLAKAIGDDLIRTNGHKKFYTQKQIKAAADRNKHSIDWHCWAYCLYMDHASFDRYHHQIGEACDYQSMKSSMVSSITNHQSDTWFDFDWDMSWLELPDIDFGSFFDFFDV